MVRKFNVIKYSLLKLLNGMPIGIPFFISLWVRLMNNRCKDNSLQYVRWSGGSVDRMFIYK